MLLCIEEVHPDAAVVVAASPAKTPEGRPARTPPTTGRGRKRPTEDGSHVMRSTTYATKKSKADAKGNSWAKATRGTCAVCKYNGNRKADDRFPMTTNYCDHCCGYVHSRGSTGYEGCWNTHLYQHIPGLGHSGDMAAAADAAAAAAAAAVAATTE